MLIISQSTPLPVRSCSPVPCIRPNETRKGDTIQADYGAYGSVSCYFA
jgi:hypothetical protein